MEQPKAKKAEQLLSTLESSSDKNSANRTASLSKLCSASIIENLDLFGQLEWPGKQRDSFEWLNDADSYSCTIKAIANSGKSQVVPVYLTQKVLKTILFSCTD